MEERTLNALKESIEKWKARASGDHSVPPIDRDCPLCQLFFDKNCTGCPVREKTKYQHCVGTPYKEYYMLRTEANAQKELDFLKSLLPPEKVEEKKPEFKWQDLNYLG